MTYETSEHEPLPFDTHVERGIAQALDSIRERFEESDRREQLPFHNAAHTEGVVNRTEQILRAVREATPDELSERDIALGKLIASFHDTVQNWEENPITESDGRHTKIMRKRFVEDNERASADELVAYMKKVNRDNPTGDVFTTEDMALAKQGIDATVPEFSLERLTVLQPKFDTESPTIAIAVAMADLGVAGMEGPGPFAAEGDTLFREENLDILDAMQDPTTLTDEQKEYFRSRMLGWSAFQPTFVKGRKGLLEEDLAGIPEQAQGTVHALFDKFDETIRVATEIAEQRKEMSFEELARDMGYEIA